MLAPVSRHHIIDAGDRYAGDGDAGERIKFMVIKPSGEMQRGALRVDLGPVKKERRRFRPIERRVRKMVRAEHRALGRYLVLHDRSRRKRRSGWVRDLPRNVFKVIRRSR
jgi:hypothetical protein